MCLCVTGELHLSTGRRTAGGFGELVDTEDAPRRTTDKIREEEEKRRRRSVGSVEQRLRNSCRQETPAGER